MHNINTKCFCWVVAALSIRHVGTRRVHTFAQIQIQSEFVVSHADYAAEERKREMQLQRAEQINMFKKMNTTEEKTS